LGAQLGFVVVWESGQLVLQRPKKIEFGSGITLK